jgi:threonine dehydrogenase-like Zn-dependent dehydrogenase
MAASSVSTDIPATMRAIVVEETGKPFVKVVPTPSIQPGAVIVKPLHALIHQNASKILRSPAESAPFTYPAPSVVGANVIGRVAVVGSDTTSLEPGQLVILDPCIRARDNHNIKAIWGYFDGITPQSKKLVADVWRHGCFAEYVLAPLENALALDEAKLCGSPTNGGLGYTPADLIYISVLSLAYAGLRAIDVKAGETIVVNPSTGLYSGGAVAVATAMGATVIATGRDMDKLNALKDSYPRAKAVQLKGDLMGDMAAIQAMGTVDAVIDVSPPESVGTSYLGSCLMAVKPYGRIALLGGQPEQAIPLPFAAVVFNSLTIKGQFMAEREDIKGLIRLIESGALRLDHRWIGKYPLDNFHLALDKAAENPGTGNLVCLDIQPEV